MKKKQLIKENMYDEGGLGGHMAHPYEYTELTFTEIFELIDDLFKARVEHVTEKLDGQNIFVTMDPGGRIKFARNGKEVEAGGFDRDYIGVKWGKPEQTDVRETYTVAYDTFSDCLNGISPNLFRLENAQIWMNCEVINTNFPNVIPYPETEVSVHALVAFQNGTKNEVEIPDYDKRLQIVSQRLSETKSEHGKAQITPEIALNIIENGKELSESFKQKLNSVVMLVESAYPSMTIDEWKKNRLKGMIMSVPKYAVLFQLGDISRVIEERIINGNKQGECHSTNIKKWLKVNMPDKLSEIIGLLDGYEKVDGPKIMKKVMLPLENFFLSLGIEVMQMVAGYENEGRKEMILNKLAADLKQKTEELKMFPENSDEYQKMVIQMRKIEEAGNRLNAFEGIVFNWRGRAMKLTGCFAPLNQIMIICWRI